MMNRYVAMALTSECFPLLDVLAAREGVRVLDRFGSVMLVEMTDENQEKFLQEYPAMSLEKETFYTHGSVSITPS